MASVLSKFTVIFTCSPTLVAAGSTVTLVMVWAGGGRCQREAERGSEGERVVHRVSVGVPYGYSVHFDAPPPG